MPLTRDDSKPCPVATEEYEWGSYCPLDQFGVHTCQYPQGHADPEHSFQLHCQCTCGTTRAFGLPKRRTGA